MSSILEALKKLEADKEEQATDFIWPQSVNAKETLRSRLKDGGFYKHPVIIFLLTAFTVTSLFILYERETQKKRAGQPVATAENTAAAPHEEAVVLETPAEVKKTPESEKTVQPELEKKPPPEEIMAGSGAEEQPVQANIEVAAVDSMEPKSSADETQEEEIAVPSTEDAVALSTGEADVETDQEYSYLYGSIPEEMLPPKKIVDENWLKLHAISWSEDPARRIAVINSVIVKEGRVVDGGLVSRIDRDYVVIVKGGEEFMLPFGLR